MFNNAHLLLARFVIVGVFFLSASTHAVEQPVDASGYGETRKLAISDALIQAVRQVTGLSISSDEVLETQAKRHSISDSSGNQHHDEFSVAKSGSLNLKTYGLVSSYDVHSVEQEEDGSYRADVTVYIQKYNPPGLSSDSRRTLAVMPLHYDKSFFYLLGDKTSTALIEKELRNRLIDEFTQSRKVNVLDRQFGSEFEAEKSLWLSNDAQVSEAGKAGNVLGADYLVVGNIRNISSIRKVETLQLTGETLQSFSGSARLDYKILLAATRQVKWSDTIDLKFSDENIRKMLSDHGSSQVGITTKLAQEVAQKALANIFPLRVVAVKGKTVIVNQGGKTLKQGDVLSVFFLGDEMFDPYTKESLGRLEEKIATVKVTRTTAKISYATVIKGEAEFIEPSFIVRR